MIDRKKEQEREEIDALIKQKNKMLNGLSPVSLLLISRTTRFPYSGLLTPVISSANLYPISSEK